MLNVAIVKMSMKPLTPAATAALIMQFLCLCVETGSRAAGLGSWPAAPYIRAELVVDTVDRQSVIATLPCSVCCLLVLAEKICRVTD